MKTDLLKQHLENYRSAAEANPEQYHKDLTERIARKDYYQSWTADRLKGMSPEDLAAYVAKLWAMRIWGNKQYVVDKLLENNGLKKLRNELAELIWGNSALSDRWDRFRDQIKGMGPAMMSELLCYCHPDECLLWNRRAFVGLRYLGIENLPRHDYQLIGKRYVELSNAAQPIAVAMREAGFDGADLLTVDYFIWEELQVEETLAQIHKKAKQAVDVPSSVDTIDGKTSTFIHNEVRDKLADIGEWLGFTGKTEIKVADGSKVDTVWEATIGNMGRVIYVFEVQTKGSIDSLILNLLKSLNNPAVQGVVAVSDAAQLEKIRKHAANVQGVGEKLRYWDYAEVLLVHESLQLVNEAINSLGLVPEGF